MRGWWGGGRMWREVCFGGFYGVGVRVLKQGWMIGLRLGGLMDGAGID